MPVQFSLLSEKREKERENIEGARHRDQRDKG
jgi:hypothetical protein